MHVSIIGAGPAGLIAAEHLAPHCQVTIHDQMASPARKFLLAGRGGLNLTHSEPFAAFSARYGAAAAWICPILRGFPPEALIAWCDGLGQEVFTGSSGRVFPRAMKAAPLLRAWLNRLDGLGVQFRARHRWLGWDADGALRFATQAGEIAEWPDATVLALGGASWPRMGSDGGWVGILRARGVDVADLRAANCGVRIGWSEIFRARFEGEPLKRIALAIGQHSVRGEAVITRDGLEGGAVYALSAPIRAALDAGEAKLRLDLRPDMSAAELESQVDGARGGRSLPNFLRQAAGLPPVCIGLVQEALHTDSKMKLSALVKALPLRVHDMQPLGRAISSSGGIRLGELDEHLMLKRLPGVFAAGEMLDWEAPTGGYLLQGCFSTGVRAAEGLLALNKKKQEKV
jgi:uncharacterized flavoprotein (TIGR03862 family)